MSELADSATITAVIKDLTTRLERPLESREDARQLAEAIQRAARSARTILGDSPGEQLVEPLLLRGREIILSRPWPHGHVRG